MRISSEDWPCRVEARESFGRTGCFSVLGKVPVAKVSTGWSPVGGKGSSPSRVTKTIVEASDCWQLEWLSVWTCQRFIHSGTQVLLSVDGLSDRTFIRSLFITSFIALVLVKLEELGCFCLEVAKSSQNFRESNFKQVRCRQLQQEKIKFQCRSALYTPNTM